MTEFKPGDRVHVEYDGIVVAGIGAGRSVLVETDGVRRYESLDSLTKLPDPLPTTPGSVIRVTKWRDKAADYPFMLTNTGWVAHNNSDTYLVAEIREWATEWELIYDAGAKR